ncbi:MAG: dolichol-phosphate mannosyltransferase, partial [Verrucomicrobiota bacterium]
RSDRHDHIDLARNAHTSGALEFSLVIPTYNERDNLGVLLQRLDRILAKQKFEVIIVDDDSPDGTWAEAQVYQQRYSWLRVIRRRGERGLSTAVICGFRHARGKILGVMDADLQHDDTRLPELLHKMRHADFAVATRRAVGGSDGKWNWMRRFVSHGATLLAKFIARVPLSDPMSGFFTMRREVFAAVDDWALNPRGYKLLVYLYARALQALGRENVRLSEVGYEFSERQRGESKLSAKVIFEFVFMLFDLRLHPRHDVARVALLPVRG